MDHTGSREKTAELHEVLTANRPYKPYAAQLAIIQRNADEGRRQDVLRTRAHAEKMRSVAQRHDEAFQKRLQEMRGEITKYNQERCKAENDQYRAMKKQKDEYFTWKTEMEERIGKIPPLGTNEREGRTVATMPDLEAQLKALKMTSPFTPAVPKAPLPHEVKKQTAQYFKDLKELKERQNTRPANDWIYKYKPPPPKPEASAQEIMSKQGREYEQMVEAMYDKHSRRVVQAKRAVSSEIRLKKETEEQLQRDRVEKFKSSSKSGKAALDVMKERVKARPKSLGGYKPVTMSDKRVRSQGHAAGPVGGSAGDATLLPSSLPA